jgi:hypothetical protein
MQLNLYRAVDIYGQDRHVIAISLEQAIQICNATKVDYKIVKIKEVATNVLTELELMKTKLNK